MDSIELLQNFLNTLQEFSKNLPEGLLIVNPKIHNNIQVSFDSLHKDIVQFSTDLQLDKRISAFVNHVQNAVDQQNIQEFLPTTQLTSPPDGCARTCAVYQRRPTRGTHLEVNRVKNREGPQTQVNSQGRWCSLKRNRQQEAINCPEGVVERLNNLEEHLRINKDTAPKDVYARLKMLEDKIIELESISPEYFRNKYENKDFVAPTNNRAQRQMTVDQIDDRILFLKKTLTNKRRKI